MIVFIDCLESSNATLHLRPQYAAPFVSDSRVSFMFGYRYFLLYVFFLASVFYLYAINSMQLSLLSG